MNRRTMSWASVLALAALPHLASWAADAAPHQSDASSVVLLDFDAVEGGSARDASGRGNDAAFEAAPNDPEWYAHGRFGGCLAFDGENSDRNGDKKGAADGLVLKAGGAPDPEGTGFTVEMWVRHAHLKGPQFYMARTSMKPGRYVFGMKGEGVYVAFLPGGADWVRAHAPGTLKPGLWHHVAFTYDKESLRIYIDGTEKARTRAKGEILAGVPQSVIGRDTDTRPGQIRGFCGLMDELRISNIARTEFPSGPHKPTAPFPKSLTVTKKPLPRVAAAKSPPGIDLSSVPLDRGGVPEDGRQIRVSGTVFLDANRNGTRDAQEDAVGGVHVSNGDEIVKTEDDGAYSFAFKIADPRHVFVTVPTGYRAAKTFYRRIRLTAATSYQYDFGLVEDPASRAADFRFIAGGDIQYVVPFATRYEQLCSDFGQMAAFGRNAAFAVFPGDLTNTGELNDLMILKKAAVEVWKKPFHAGFGAHDVLNPSKMGNFMDVFGPYYYSWDYGNSHVIFLVSEISRIRGEREARQFRWLERDVALQPKDKPIYVICHTPEHISAHLERIARTHNLKAIIRGHYHINNIYEGPGGVPVICSAPYRSKDWGVFTRKCRVVRSEGGRISSRMRVLGQVKRLVITSPAPGGFIVPGKVTVQANAYDTAVQVTDASFEIIAPDGSRTRGKLRPHSDFSWWGVWDATRAGPGDYRITVTARTNEDAPWEKTEAFRCVAEPDSRPAPAADWPSVFGGDHKRRAVRHSITPPLRLAWIGHTDALVYYFSSPIIVDGRVVIGVTDGEVGAPRGGVICFDAVTGRRLWQTQTDADVHSSVAALDGKVYALSTMGRVSCVDIEIGNVLWTRDIHKPRFGWTMSMGPVSVRPGRVFVRPDSSGIACLDADTGKVLWQSTDTDGYYSTSTLGVFQGVGYTSSQGYYAAVDMGTGEFLWKHDIKRCRGMSTPTRVGDTVYVPHRAILRAVRADTGEELWQRKLSGSMTQSPGMAVEKDGRVFVTCGDGLYGIDAATGGELWKVTTSDPKLFTNSKYQSLAESSSPAVSGDYVYVGSDNGTFYCIEAATGTVAWSYYIGVPIKSSPAISGNMVVISAFDGNVYAFTARSAVKQ